MLKTAKPVVLAVCLMVVSCPYAWADADKSYLDSEKSLIRPAEAIELRWPSPDKLRRMLGTGESAYRAGRSVDAIAAFEAVVALDPTNTRAQLRLGNLYHQAGRDLEALRSYSIASASAELDPAEADIRAKAQLNMALIHLDLAQEAVSASGQEATEKLQSKRRAVSRKISLRQQLIVRDQEKGVDQLVNLSIPKVLPLKESPDFNQEIGLSAARPGNKDSQKESVSSCVSVQKERPSPLSGTAQPHTVDRWFGYSRKAPTRSNPARPTVGEPITETPLLEPPQVETVHGFSGGK